MLNGVEPFLRLNERRIAMKTIGSIREVINFSSDLSWFILDVRGGTL